MLEGAFKHEDNKGNKGVIEKGGKYFSFLKF
jgi:redox-sensitive bicupin YhaK (pirin superfamily)